jgi:hypothetical protein
VAQQLTHFADEAGADVEDVVQAGPQAPALASLVLPLVIAGLLVGVVAALASSRGLGKAGVLSLTVLAIAAALAGLHAVAGRAGLAIGALAMIFVGNPFSGVGSAPDLLPEPTAA